MSKKRVCPSCGKEYTDEPAASRRDGSDICPECGEAEAIAERLWELYRKEAKEWE